MQLVLTPQLMIQAYKQGLFPMAYSAASPYVHWVCPEKRGQLPIDTFHIPRRLRKTLRAGAFDIRTDLDFKAVIRKCAEPAASRPESWINEPIIEAFCKLHDLGYAHSVEAYEPENGYLVGGVYGLALGGAFFAESMFSRARDASKVALVHLVARLWAGGFMVLDTQFVNDHLRQFGVYDLTHEAYMARLAQALQTEGHFNLPDLSEDEILTSFLTKGR